MEPTRSFLTPWGEMSPSNPHKIVHLDPPYEMRDTLGGD